LLKKSSEKTTNAVTDSTSKPNVTTLDKLIMTPKFINNFDRLCIMVSLDSMVI
jgi:hypothetical protein